jgi:hypothetical protein
MKRPFRVTILVVIGVITAIGNGLRLCEALFFWRVLEEYNAYPLYVAISGGFWLIASVFITIGIIQGRTWAWAGTIGCVIVYWLWYWFDRLVLQVAHANWPFAIANTLLFVGFCALILFNSKTNAYFIKHETSHE